LVDKGLHKNVSLWHPWQDKLGMPFVLTRLQNGNVYTSHSGLPLCDVSSIERMIQTVTHNRLFLLCEDIMSENEIPYIDDLIVNKASTPFVSRTGNISGMRVSNHGSGYIVPAKTWSLPWIDIDMLARLEWIFKAFGYQATTPASLSEKVLRSTLPERLFISRPSVMVRTVVLENHRGGRIDKARQAEYLPQARSYDKNKAYLCHSRLVPSPFSVPVHRSHPPVEVLGDYPTGFWQVRMIARSCVIAPLILKDGRIPVEGECVDIWLWTGEIYDCIEAGFTLLSIERGYAWLEMSDFMCPWTDILWDTYSSTDDKLIRTIIKQMMVGLPGRFLKHPETFKIVGIDEARKGDIPLFLKWTNERRFSNFYIRPIDDPESTALTPIGNYIVREMARELYRRMRAEHLSGNRVLRSYIDCYTIDGITVFQDDLGTDRGMWKEQIFHDAYVEENRIKGDTPDGESVVKHPGGNGRLGFVLRSIEAKDKYYGELRSRMDTEKTAVRD
jgi:hypothetical protein